MLLRTAANALPCVEAGTGVLNPLFAKHFEKVTGLRPCLDAFHNFDKCCIMLASSSLSPLVPKPPCEALGARATTETAGAAVILMLKVGSHDVTLPQQEGAWRFYPPI